ncbi:MAG: hypothetical protein CL846_04180 [Crocinitomicaceae bacterium]|nr:hypothetical protein [Crocinitomicaceae bacterium]|tara:strand:- start:18303 stop:18818 length:516 start_codon:yes stop_codon:yes gene_type:complete
MSNLIKNISWFFGLILFQILILDEIDIGPYSVYFSPMLFSYLILRLKLDISVSILLLYAFLIGITVDIFKDTIGLNAAALLFVAILRKYFLSIISERDEFDSMVELDFFNLGFVRYLIYFGLGMITHHFVFALIEGFSFNGFLFLLYKSLINTFFALAILFFIQYLIIKKK